MRELHRFRSQRQAEGFKEGVHFAITEIRVDDPIYNSDYKDGKCWTVRVYDNRKETVDEREVVHKEVEPYGYNKIILESGAGYSWASFQVILLGGGTIRGDSRTNYAALQMFTELVRHDVKLDGEVQHFILKLMKDFKVDVKRSLKIMSEYTQDSLWYDGETFWKGNKEEIIKLWDFRVRMFETKGSVMCDMSNGPQLIDIA